MKHVAWIASITLWLVSLTSTAVGCNQTLADSYDQKIRAAINTRDYAALEKYAVQQAAVYRACAGQASGHTRTRYLLGEAASWDQAAQALNNEALPNAQKKRVYAQNAIRIATPISTAADSSANEKKAAKAILWTLSWVHAG